MKDLFLTPDEMPKELKEILDSFEAENNNGDDVTYPKLEELKSKVNAIGYTFDFYLDAVLYDLRPINNQS